MNVFESVVGVFEGVTTWFVDAFNNVMPLFYTAEAGLTLVGTLAVVGLGISITFLLINTVRSWFQLRN